jgi:DNA invertase Pin-like site-specific DNA recombinase
VQRLTLSLYHDPYGADGRRALADAFFEELRGADRPSVPVEEVRKMRSDGKGLAEIAEALGVSRMSVWRALNG